MDTVVLVIDDAKTILSNTLYSDRSSAAATLVSYSY